MVKTTRFLLAALAALFLGNLTGQAQQAADVYYNVNVTDPNSSLSDIIYVYHYDSGPVGSPSYNTVGTVGGNLPDMGFGSNTFNVGNPFNVYATTFTLFGLDTVTSNGAVTPSVFIGFNAVTSLSPGTNFNAFFAPFFSQHTDITADESTIVAALGNPDLTDNDTNDHGGSILYQFGDYVVGLDKSNPSTAASINGGSLTLYHFSDATALGATTAEQVCVAPEPSTWAAVLAGVGGLALALRRRARG